MSWGDGGIILVTNPENAFIDEPAIASDGSGGAIIAWHQYPAGKVVGGTPEWFLQDILTQRIDSGGNIMWQQSGVPLGIVRAAEIASPHTPRVVSDGSGGAIIIWEDLRNGLASIYGQRITRDGTPIWQAGGAEILYVKSNASLAFRNVLDYKAALNELNTAIAYKKNYKDAYWTRAEVYTSMKKFQAALKDLPAARVGRVTREPKLVISGLAGGTVVNTPVAKLKAAWQKPFAW